FLKTIRSKSVQGLSSIALVFAEKTDLLAARQLVQERLATAASLLPDSASAPVVMPPHSSLSRVLKIGLSSETLSPMELSELALWTIRPRLMSVPGVANVAIWGQRNKQYQVVVDPDRLRVSGVTLEALVEAARDAVVMESGGYVDTPNQRMAIWQRMPVASATDLGRNLVEFRNGTPIRIEDVADVRIGSPPLIGEAVINDGPGILLVVGKQPWGNTLDVTRGIEKVLEDLRPGLAGVEMDSTIFRPATFIETAIHNLGQALWLGCLLVVLVLVFFLYDARTAIISITAIPLSLLGALLVIHKTGQTINTMVLAGLVIAIGEVVDDAIIDVENIYRRLRLNRLLPQPRPAFQVVLDASLEVRSAVVYASLIVILVFVPVFFLPGLAGTFFRPLAFTYIAAITTSLLVALTVTPAMSLVLLRRGRGKTREAPVVALLKRVYSRLLAPAIRHPRSALVVVILCYGGTALLWGQLGEEFLPDFQERDFLMHWVEKPGTSIDAMRRITVEVSKELRSIPGVRNFGAHIGRAEVADEVVGANFTELWISVDPEVDYQSTLRRITDVVEGYPGLYRDVLTYLRERVKEVLTGTSATIVVRIYGPDLDSLRALAHRAEDVMREVEGVTSLKVEHITLIPQIQIQLDAEAVAEAGLTPGQVRRDVATYTKGSKVGEIYEDQKVHDVVVWGNAACRTDVQALRELPIMTSGRHSVTLGHIAQVAIHPEANTIKREGSSRRIDVTCNVTERDLGSVARDIERAVRAMSFPQGYHPEFLGEFAEREEATRRLMVLALMAVAGILVLLQVDFQSTRCAAIVAFSLPFCLAGGVAAAYFTGRTLSLGSIVGFVTVLGIAARNGIMLVSHYRHLEAEEQVPFGPDLVLQGSLERLSPILMTVCTTALALVPLIVKGNVPGHEIEYPMAIVILGGLVSSTLLNLFVLPSVYLVASR
ncbi:MAG: efflux RND transporter permease subunit, partial [Actinobacteria bacterium]|nr:efflux RND transporter permease subunit [Actinomycetota bacterium]